jgi:NarL family two-component system response regulator LiaR
MCEPITLLIVDDHAVVRRGARAYLEAEEEFAVIGDVGSGAEALLLAAHHSPDVILMDLAMPGMDGVEATRRMKQISPRSQIIVLTSYHDDEHLFPALRAGALSYLLKDVPLSDLADAIRKAARGEATMHPLVAARLVQEQEQARGTRHRNVTLSGLLSEREQEVLRLIAEGCSNAEIARRLVISEKTVKSHVGNILGKLHLEDRTQVAVFAWREGLVQPPEDEKKGRARREE